MGDIEALILDLFIAIKQNVEVNVARAFVNYLLPAHLALNGLQLVQERQGLQVCLNLCHNLAPSLVATRELYVPRRRH